MTPELLRAAVGCSPELAERYSEPLGAACAFYGIDTPARLAAFLAQVGHESGSLRYTTELASGSAYDVGRLAVRLGNTPEDDGDGERYRGRGLIQTTGLFNYRRVRDRLRERFPTLNVPDFEADPEALTDPQWAALSAADYWDDRGLNALADAGEFARITRKINGGLNGQADRLARWERAKRALQQPAPLPTSVPTFAAADEPLVHLGPEPQQEQPPMPLPLIPLLGVVLPSIIEAIPKLGKLFGSGSEVQERNVKAAELAVNIVQEAVGARNAQEAAEMVRADPAAAQAAIAAVEQRWFELSESGGGGIDGARKADAAAVASGSVWQSPSFWAFVMLTPLVYLIVGSVVGLWGKEWPPEVRAAIATAVVSLVVGGAAGYYWGATTSRNRSPAP